jgi:DNA-binding transcriptional regulator YbjK
VPAPTGSPAPPARAGTSRGTARREAIVAAAAALVTAGGPAAVSHRAVAAAASVPLAATTYYFRSLEDLLAAAVERAAAVELDRGTALVAALPRRRRSARGTAQVVLEVLLGPDRPGDAELLAHYERFLAVGRHPALRPVLRRSRARLDALLDDALDRCGHRGVDLAHLVAVVDGTIVSALVEGDGDAHRRAVEVVTAHLNS